jgi:hypothetical protein
MDCAGTAVAYDRFSDHAPGNDQRSIINGIYCEPFHPDHADQIEVAGIDADHYQSLANPSELIKKAAFLGPFYTCWAGDKILTISGVCLLWPGVGEAAVFVSGIAPRYPVALTKVIKVYLDLIIQQHNLHRVQCAVLERFAKSVAWVRLLGFKPEGEMKWFGPNKETFIRYSRIIGGGE